MIRMFIGYDPVESVAWHVFNHSIQRRASQPVEVAPVMLSQLPEMIRERDPKQSNDFSYSRWLVPYLCGYDGWAIFADCDMLCLDDIAKLWAMRDERYAVMCVKHNHVPTEEKKYLGNDQHRYEKKNWSSVMLFNCAKCTALTPIYVNKATGLELHQFKWLGDDELIGDLDPRWNILIGYDDLASFETPGILHYTIGGPYFHEYYGCPGTTEWMAEKADMLLTEQYFPRG